ncbi:MAG: DUF2149 domain-containing protein [Lentisphaeria bacterium]|nr:DUF2149 domain-containing protein [Lentisphaeria bacterium]
MRFMRDAHDWMQDPDSVDPMSGVANLFDTAMVFIAALLLALITVFDARDIFSKDSNLTIVKKNDHGEMTIIKKQGRRIQAVKMTREAAAGRGTRLGTAYRLEDGSMIYVPEE